MSEFFDEIVNSYICEYNKITGVESVSIDDYYEDSVGRKYWFSIQLKRNENGKRYFAKRLDVIKKQLVNICFQPDRIYNIIMPERIAYKNMFNEWTYKYDADHVGIEIFIYNKNER